MACNYAQILAYNETLRQQLLGMSLTERVSALYIVAANILKALDPDAETNPGVLLRDYSCLKCYSFEDQLVVVGAMLCTLIGDLLPPVILVHPQNVTIFEGETWLMSVTATGSPVLRYQWRFNGFPILGATTATFGGTNTPISAAGFYDVIVTNPVGAITSQPGILRVNPLHAPPVIIQQPQSLTVNEGQPSAFTVVATGSAPLSYQWYHDGVEIPGATLNFFTINITTMPDEGVYQVRVTNPYGSVISDDATLTVIAAAMFRVYLGNAGPDAPASYTEGEITSLENRLPGLNFTDVLEVEGRYEIYEPTSGENEYRIIAFPTAKVLQVPLFASVTTPLSMDLVQDDLMIGGEAYSVYRTVARSAGDFTVAGNTAIIVL